MPKRRISLEQALRIEKFIKGDNLDFYEEFIINLSDEEQKSFFADNPDFMSEFPISHDRIYLLKDKLFRNILRKIKQYEERE